MTDNNKMTWQFWLIAGGAILWNAMGALDFTMTQTKNEAYLSAFTPEQLAYFDSFPMWAVALWGIAVWGGLIGSVLLALRKALSVQVFLFSLLAMIAMTVYNYGFSDGLQMAGSTFELVFTGLIFVISVALYLYAKSCELRGLLS